jgi:putative spermidine/putrescine transport system substrate-binding protein
VKGAKVKKILAALMVMAALALAFPAFGEDDSGLLKMDFKQIEQAARGQTVRFYMFGGFAHVNQWIDTYVAGEMKKRYDVTVKRVPMDAAVFMNKLINEKAAGKKDGSIDLLWINGENFKNARQADLLFGPFASNLPNFQKYVDPATVQYDFGFPVGEFEAPYGRAQFVFEYDTARTSKPPMSFKDLKAWILANPGRFTYPQPPDFTGSAFIRQVLYAAAGGHEQFLKGFDQELYDKTAPQLWAYLNEIKPALWQKGRTYPQDSAALDTLFARGEVDFGMSYHPSHAQSKILEGTYPKTVRTLIMDEGAIFNTHFTAIPKNAVNKAAALVTANFLMSPEAQYSKYDPANWGDFPAVDLPRLPEEWRQKFKTLDLGPATLPPDVLAAKAVPEIPSEYLEKLEAGWERNVLR